MTPRTTSTESTRGRAPGLPVALGSAVVLTRQRDEARGGPKRLDAHAIWTPLEIHASIKALLPLPAPE